MSDEAIKIPKLKTDLRGKWTHTYTVLERGKKSQPRSKVRGQTLIKVDKVCIKQTHKQSLTHRWCDLTKRRAQTHWQLAEVNCNKHCTESMVVWINASYLGNHGHEREETKKERWWRNNRHNEEKHRRSSRSLESLFQLQFCPAQACEASVTMEERFDGCVNAAAVGGLWSLVASFLMSAVKLLLIPVHLLNAGWLWSRLLATVKSEINRG